MNGAAAFSLVRFDLKGAAVYIAIMARALAIDYGRRRVGLAYSDPDQIIVSHRETLLISGMNDAIKKLTEFIRVNEIGEVVIGYPLREDGSPGEICSDVEHLKDSLAKMLPELTIELADERYTSHIGTKIVHQSGKKIGSNKGRIDAAAAGVILDDYMNRNGKGQ